MKSFPIVVNKIEIMSDEIYTFLKAGKAGEAIEFIEKTTNCQREEAMEIVQELIDLSKGVNYKKKWKYTLRT